MTALYPKSKQLKTNKVKTYRRKCRHCKDWFKTELEKQVTCGKVNCAIEYGKSSFKKQRKQENEQKKKEVNIDSKGGLKDKVQKVVNKYIRIRDQYKPCVSCGKSEVMQFDAGHYENVHGHPQLRFNTLNIHKQCSHCNCQLSANKVPYREELIKRIGLDKVEKLEQDQSVKKYDVEYLERLRKVFNKKIRLYERKFR